MVPRIGVASAAHRGERRAQLRGRLRQSLGRRDLPAQTAACLDEACGDNVEQLGETCDDGNTVSGDGCAATCQAEAEPPPEEGGCCGSGGAGASPWLALLVMLLVRRRLTAGWARSRP